jgi:hypothetical protein
MSCNTVLWNCPNCDADNTDLLNETASPTCSDCDTSYDWSDIWHVSDNLTEYLNLIDTLSIKRYGKAAVELEDGNDSITHSLQDDFNNAIKPDIALANAAKIAGIT